MLISSSLFKIPLQWNYPTKNRLLHWTNLPLLRKPLLSQWIPKVPCIRGCKMHSNTANSSSARRTKWKCNGATLSHYSWSTMVRATCPVHNHWCIDHQEDIATVNSQIQTISHCVIEERSKLCGVKTILRCLSQSVNTKHLRWNHKSQEMLRYDCRVIDWCLIWIVPKNDFNRITLFSIFFCLVSSIVWKKRLYFPFSKRTEYWRLWMWWLNKCKMRVS